METLETLQHELEFYKRRNYFNQIKEVINVVSYEEVKRKAINRTEWKLLHRQEHCSLKKKTDNQCSLEVEIRTLIADNEKLSAQVGALLQERLQQARVEDDDELKRQLALLTKERDSLHVLWQTSQKTIDALETELNTYQSHNYRNKQGIIEDRRDLELKLETALTDYIELETKHKDLNNKTIFLETDIKNKTKEITTYKERGKELDSEIETLRKELEECKINLAAEVKSNKDLKQQLNLCHKDSVNIVRKEAEAKLKVAEALQLFDVVNAQKNEALKKIADFTKELSDTKRLLADIERNIELKHRNELDALKEQYNEKIADMLIHIKNLDSELVEKGVLLNKTLREVKILQEANENYLRQQQDNLKTVDPKLALAEQRLEAMFQELVSSERRNIQLVCEKQCLAVDIQRIQDIHSRETKRRDWEEKLLKTQCDELRMQVDHLQKSLDETHGMVNKLQRMLTSRTELNHKMVSTKEEELTELNKHLENQMELNKKWKDSYVEMTEKLKNRLEEMQKENNELRAKLKICSKDDEHSISCSS